MSEVWGLIRTVQIRDIFDILIVAGIFYAIFSMMRETRSAVALRGMILILIGTFIIYFIARLLTLNALLLMFETFWVVVILVFIIVFQNELRRSLTRVGQMRVFRRFFTQSGRYMDDVTRAVDMMSKRRVGALIALERRNPLRVYAETGVQIDAKVTAELIRTIFTAYAPLHDGAIIIRDDRVVAAGCILPLVSDSSAGRGLGTRHRAALGLSEETDAVVVVVSEETGLISTAVAGELRRGWNTEELHDYLNETFEIDSEEGAHG